MSGDYFIDPEHPALDFDLPEFLGRLPWLSEEERGEVARFLVTAVAEPMDGTVQLATLVVAALTTLRKNGTDGVAQALLAIAEELARRVLATAP